MLRNVIGYLGELKSNLPLNKAKLWIDVLYWIITKFYFTGQASSEKTKGIGGLVTLCADLGCQFIEREEEKRNQQTSEQGRPLFLIS